MSGEHAIGTYGTPAQAPVVSVAAVAAPARRPRGPIGATELARILGKSRVTVYRWTRAGKIPASAVQWFGRVPRYFPAELARLGWVTSNRVLERMAP